MKRGLNSEHSIGAGSSSSDMKRHHSMFSIATIMDLSEDRSDHLKLCYSTEELRGKLLVIQQQETSRSKGDSHHPRQVSFTSGDAMTGLLKTNNSNSDNDFFIADEDEEISNSLLNPFQATAAPPIINSTATLPPEEHVLAAQSQEAITTTKVQPIVSATDVEQKKVQTSYMKTGVVFEASAQHFDRHNRFHKERPLRVTSIYDALIKAGFNQQCTLFESLIEQQNDTLTTDTSPEMDFLNDDDFLRVHLPGYMQRYVLVVVLSFFFVDCATICAVLRFRQAHRLHHLDLLFGSLDKLSQCTCLDRLDREASQFKSIFFTPDSVRQAKVATATLCRLVSKVVASPEDDESLDNGFAIIRPPGHHAEPGLAGGYCVVNNVAVAASYAREKLGVKRILIVDWDVHHGNGTQSIFLHDPNVMYFSIHRWHGGNFFPFLKNGGPTTVGVGDGAGYNVNVGWSHKGMGDDEYEAVWHTVLMPMAREYQPDLVLVSAGFDAAHGDMGECHVTPECFGMLTRSLKTLGKVVCTLEGGYIRSVLGDCVKEVVMALLECDADSLGEEDQDDNILEEIDLTAAKNIRATIAAHRPYWSCFQQR